MASGKGEETALGSARGRFNESLPRKAIELRGAMALLTATPGAEGPREDMRRRLHTLYASALVFRNDALAHAVKDGIDRLDTARDQKRPLDNLDLETLATLVRRLPELRGELGDEKAERAPFAMNAGTNVSPSAPGRQTRTLTGLQPVGAEERRKSSVPPPIPAPTALSSLGPAPSKPTNRGPLLQMVVHVLALAPRGELAQLRALLPHDTFELEATHEVDEALSVARSHAPDVIIADRALAASADLVRRLRSDPLTDFVPVVLVQHRADAVDALTLREAGADEVLLRPLDVDSLVLTLGRVTGTLLDEGSGLLRLGDATLDEVAERVADEIRRGLVDSAESGRELKIPLGEGAEVLAAAWAAVARVRAFVAQQSGGRVRFQDQPRRGGPALLGLVGGEADVDAIVSEGTLNGRRIIVVDDDPAVVWFFAGLLREEGATVVECTDGGDALKAARKERPDVVISDILMPSLDGFALCRELKRDPALSDVPVILISWKEDLLHRMRELSSGASGYLRKEAGAARILESVRDVLRARAKLEAQLTAGGEVRGSLEGTGVVALIRSTKRTRPNARLTIRDAWNLFEVELRGGRLMQLTRTASDGSFARGERALPQLLGANAGRFVITDAEAPLKAMFDGTLEEVLRRGAIDLGAVIDAVSGAMLMRIQHVTFDEDAYPIVLKQSPEPVRVMIERLHRGESPSLLLVSGVTSAQTLESVLIDLARRGAIREVHAKNGDDLIAEAKRARTEQAGLVVRSIIPEPPRPVISVIGAPEDNDKQLPSVLDPAAAASLGTFTLARPMAHPVKSDSTIPGAAAPGSGRPPPTEKDEEAATNEFEPVSRERAESVLDPKDTGVAAREVAAAISGLSMSLPAPPDSPEGRMLKGEPPTLLTPEPTEEDPPEPPAQAVQKSNSSPPPAMSDEVASQTARERAAMARAEEVAESDPAAVEERRSKSTLWGWLAAATILFAIAFFVERGFEPSPPGRVSVIGDRTAQLASSARKEEPATGSQGDVNQFVAPAPPAVAGALPRADIAVAPQDAGFEVVNGISDPSIVTTAKQGLLIIEKVNEENAVLTIDGAKVSELPVKTPIDEGMHELAIARGDEISYRYLSAHPGKTWILRAP